MILPASAAETIMLALPSVTADTRREIIRFRVAQTPTACERPVWSFASLAGPALGCDVLLSAVPEQQLKELGDSFRRHGLELRWVLPQPLVTAERVRELPEAPDDGVMYIRRDGSHATLLSRRHGRPHVRLVHLGGAIENTGVAPTTEPANEPSHPSMAEVLSREVMRSSLAAAQSGSAVVRRLILLDCLGQAPALASELARRLGVEVETVASPSASDVSPSPGPDTAMLSAVTRILRRPTEEQGNLLPAHSAGAPDSGPALKAKVAAMAMLVAGLSVSLWHLGGQRAAVRLQNAEIARAIALVAGPEKFVAAIPGADLISQDLCRERNAFWIGLLSDWEGRLSNVGDVWLDLLRLVPSAAGRGPAEVAVRISGRAIDRDHAFAPAGEYLQEKLKAVIQSLRQSNYVRSVKIDDFDVRAPGTIAFEATVALRFDGNSKKQ
ncbi:MAG TPA: hypothetical protein VGM73_00555 [Candidatus Didemnitutus sp.]